MRIAFFHGLESPPISDKSKWIKSHSEFSYCPVMNYSNPRLFEKTLEYVVENKIELLTGSSMGGWFAYCISTLTGIPCVIFNPAVHSRTFNPVVRIGNEKANHTIVLGKKDDVIDPIITEEWFKKNGVGNNKIYHESNDHRTPVDIFVKYVVYRE